MSYGQLCNHHELSKTSDIKIEIKRINRNPQMDSCVIKVAIFVKSSSKLIQEIQYCSEYIFGDAFSDCGNVRSFSTHVNQDSVALDNDYGDIVIADFNFDRKDDFAIKNNSGGNGGPEYRFYIRDANGEFIFDKFLSEKMIYFPVRINNANRTLTTLVHANARQLTETKYKLNPETRKWKMVKSRLLSANL